MGSYLTTGDVAKMCGVSANGVIKWIKSGKLKAFKTPGGQRRIVEEDFLTFAKEYNYPINVNPSKQSTEHKILFISQNKHSSAIFKHFTEKYNDNLSVLTASNAYGACIKFGTMQPDAIILDVDDFKSEALEMLDQLQSDNPARSFKTILLSCIDQVPFEEKVESATEVWLKPLSLTSLETHFTKFIR